MLVHNLVVTGSLTFPTAMPISGSLLVSGSMGIGTASPASKLVVVGDAIRYMPVSDANGNSVLVIKDDSSDGTLDIASEIIGNANSSSSPITFRVSSIAGGRFEAMRITNSGSVGIGTTAPVTLNSADANVTIYAGQDCSLTLKDSVENWELYCNDDLYITTGSIVHPSMVFKRISGRVGIGTADPRATLQVSNPVAGSPTLPSAGQSGSYTSLYLTNANFQYGMLMGSLPNGNSWIQVQRTDGTATTYDLQLQPNGGSVTAGAVISAGTYLQSASGIYLASGAGNNAAIGSTRGGFSTTFALNLASLLPNMNFASNNYALWITIMATNVAIQYNALVNGTVNTVNSAGSNPVTGTSWSGTASAPILTFTSSTNQYWSAILWCCGT